MAGEKSKAAAEKPKGEIQWTVQDTNAVPTTENKDGFRVHLTRDKTEYKLHHSRGTAMPMRHAVDFLCDPAFKVFDDKGELVPFIKQGGADAAPTKLAPGQVIAVLAELSDQALLVRAKRINRLATRDIGRDALIDLILKDGAGESVDALPDGAPEGSGEAELAEDE